MVPLKKNTSQVATTATSKAKSTAAGGTGPTDVHPPHPDVLIEDIGEGRLLQMLASLQRHLDEQRAEAAHEHEEAALVSDAVTCVQN